MKENTTSCEILFVFEKPYLTILGKCAWKGKINKKTCFFALPTSKTLFCTLSQTPSSKRRSGMSFVHNLMSCWYLCASHNSKPASNRCLSMKKIPWTSICRNKEPFQWKGYALLQRAVR
jgi:hypothetical protein